MHIGKVYIKNFRNFKETEVKLGKQMVIVGENKIGKSNFIHALRLILDPTLPDSHRLLQESDFWDGLNNKISNEEIRIDIELADFASNKKLSALLADFLVSNDPITAGISYIFKIELDDEGNKEPFFKVQGTQTGNTFSFEQRKWLPLEVLSALRDTENDLSNWKKSPLRPLIETAIKKTDKIELEKVANEINESTNSLKELPEIKILTTGLNNQLKGIVGGKHAIETSLGFSPTDITKLYRAIKMFIDDGNRGIAEASLGSANLLYLVLKLLSLEQYVHDNNRTHTFFAVEEPEAHLHPHLQRLLYKFLLNHNMIQSENGEEQKILNVTNILTTHSPHIASVAPLRSIVLLKKSLSIDDATEFFSTNSVDLEEKDVQDLERYINVTRGEILFAKGVILVEGDAEEFLLPSLAEQIGIDLDKEGITICSVSGTNFLPYVKLLGPQGLNIPFSILTDFDPRGENLPLIHNRLIKLLNYIDKQHVYDKEDTKNLVDYGNEFGIFTNSHTLEVELTHFMADELFSTMEELATSQPAKERATFWNIFDEVPPDPLKTFLSDIESIGKGRFAQRLATNLKEETQIPSYIKEALMYVIDKV